MHRGGRKPYERPEARGRNADEGLWVHDRAPGFSNASTPESNTKLVVTNLHYSVNEKDLAKIFGVIGTLAKEPVIRYDRSGRSMGTAYIQYTSANEATRAKEQLDGVAAKGEQMKIIFDSRPPPGTGRAKLIDRVQKPNLSSRLSEPEMQVDAGRRPGPVRSRTPRGSGRPRGGGGKRPSPRGTPTAKTLEDLDKELEAFMGDGEKPPANATAEPKPAEASGDVAMA